jgi:DNA-directed RNA polymerase subunit L
MMELRKIREDKNLLEIELKGESIGFANLIKEELWNDNNVDEAAYIKEHPYMAEPKIYVKTKGKSSPKVAIERAIKRIQVKLKEFEREFKKALKD